LENQKSVIESGPTLGKGYSLYVNLLNPDLLVFTLFLGTPCGVETIHHAPGSFVQAAPAMAGNTCRKQGKASLMCS
jgi:hypothetical protein